MYEIYVSVNRAPFEPYEMGPIYSERQAALVVARLSHTSEICGSDRRYEFRKI